MRNGIEEREINFWDLLWAVCMKWRSAVACGVLLAVLAGGFSYFASANEIKAKKEITLEELEKVFTLEEENAVDLYCEYEDMYNEQSLYNENAPLMKLDANGFYKGELTYYVDNHYEVEYPYISKMNNIIAISSAYKAVLNTEGFVDKLKKVLDADNNDSYVTEVIDCDNIYSSENSVDNSLERGILTVSIYAADEEICIELKELVSEEIEAVKTTVTKRYGEHDISLIQDTCKFTSDEKILTYQKTNIDNVQSMLKSMTDLSAKFTEQQKSYLEARRTERLGLEVQREKDENVVPVVSKKLVLLGFVGGAVFVFFLFAIVYIASNRIRLEDDFEQIYPCKLLGNVQVKERKKKKWFGFVDKFFEKMRHYNQRYFEAEEAYDMIAANIRIASRKEKINKIIISGASNVDETFLLELSKRLKDDSLDILVVSPFLYNAESFEKVVETGSVVLVERDQVSLYNEIEKEIQICEYHNIKLIGCVMTY